MLNNFSVMGRLTGDPERRETQSGKVCVSFNIACDRDFTSEGGQKTDFFACVAWGSTAEFIAKYFAKGAPILISGRVQIRAYEAKDGGKRYATEVIVDRAYFAGKKPENIPNGYAEIDADDGDLPF